MVVDGLAVSEGLAFGFRWTNESALTNVMLRNSNTAEPSFVIQDMKGDITLLTVPRFSGHTLPLLKGCG